MLEKANFSFTAESRRQSIIFSCEGFGHFMLDLYRQCLSKSVVKFNTTLHQVM